ncbi:hypothetical protein I204_05238 [Kwoniella mangroviensis CBS 8886]|uniref:uncharacterized protein n=1 Tax=Kwoniella mangroviensis CBS 8507 TaxID=1296122 RepID=UPI00080D5AB9|nr:uncharacterized protein I203_04591 [Kwoniella mangroviensis CBS 8507]OCF66264.1 hypothetical protein I203_04591 [Kwoniella mangroviensis CBS 8507]OCF73401.1 hypothetical protein I204_05238 [Kwoniella mangroviensis CBS 8886]
MQTPGFVQFWTDPNEFFRKHQIGFEKRRAMIRETMEHVFGEMDVFHPDFYKRGNADLNSTSAAECAHRKIVAWLRSSSRSKPQLVMEVLRRSIPQKLPQTIEESYFNGSPETDEAIANVLFDPDSQDLEEYTQECAAVLHRKKIEKAKEAHAPSDRIPFSTVTFNPPIPVPSHATTKEELPKAIKQRIMEGIRNCRTLPMNEIIRQVDEFAELYLVNKSLVQLKIIDQIPQDSLTLDCVQVVSKSSSRLNSVIYLKYVYLSIRDIRKIAASQNLASTLYGRRCLNYLESLGAADDQSKVYLTHHVGRCCTGENKRRHGEFGSVNNYDEVIGARPWIEALPEYGITAPEVEYLPLAEHSNLEGEEWPKRMVSTTSTFMTIMSHSEF